MEKITGLGTVNGYMAQSATLNGERFIYNGTTRGLEAEAIKRGATVGDTVTTHVLGNRTYVLEFNRHVTANPQHLQAVLVTA